MQISHSAPIRFAQGKQNKDVSYFVYIVRCQDNSLYTGITWNLRKRISEHNTGIFPGFTKSRRPVKLIYWEKLEDKYLAAKREREIKGWLREKKEKLIASLYQK